MQHTLLKSSHIVSVGYDPDAGAMHVSFRNGDVHEFSNVPQHVHDAFVNAESSGAHFHKFIKPLGGRRIK